MPRSVSRPEWNGSFSSDGGSKYKLTPAEQARRRKAKVSCNLNTSSSGAPTKHIGHGKTLKVTKSGVSVSLDESIISSAGSSLEHSTILDLLGNESDNDVSMSGDGLAISPTRDDTLDLFGSPAKPVHTQGKNMVRSPAREKNVKKYHKVRDFKVEVRAPKRVSSPTAATAAATSAITSSSFSRVYTHTQAHFPPRTQQYSSPPSPSSSSSSNSNEVREILQQIQTLQSELVYYEQITGRRSAFDMDPAEDIHIHVDSSLNEHNSLTVVMRHLTQLTCKSMSYLLKAEVDLQASNKAFQDVTAKVDLLTSALLPHSADILERAGAYQRQGDDKDKDKADKAASAEAAYADMLGLDTASRARRGQGRGEYVAANYSQIGKSGRAPVEEEEVVGEVGENTDMGNIPVSSVNGDLGKSGLRVHLTSAPNPFRVFSANKLSATNIPSLKSSIGVANNDSNLGVFVFNSDNENNNENKYENIYENDKGNGYGNAKGKEYWINEERGIREFGVFSDDVNLTGTSATDYLFTEVI